MSTHSVPSDNLLTQFVTLQGLTFYLSPMVVSEKPSQSLPFLSLAASKSAVTTNIPMVHKAYTIL